MILESLLLLVCIHRGMSGVHTHAHMWRPGQQVTSSIILYLFTETGSLTESSTHQACQADCPETSRDLLVSTYLAPGTCCPHNFLHWCWVLDTHIYTASTLPHKVPTHSHPQTIFHFLSLMGAATELGIREKATEKNDAELNPNLLII